MEGGQVHSEDAIARMLEVIAQNQEIIAQLAAGMREKSKKTDKNNTRNNDCENHSRNKDGNANGANNNHDNNKNENNTKRPTSHFGLGAARASEGGRGAHPTRIFYAT